MKGIVLTVVIAISVSAVATFVVADSVMGDSFHDYNERASDWCEDRHGDLYNARVIGPHGGLHCELPNGTHVHMSDVVDPP